MTTIAERSPITAAASNGHARCEIVQGDALTVLRGMESESVHCCCTSPPYYGLRAYKTEPVIFGGNPECAHEWVTERIFGEMRRGIGQSDSPASTRGGGKKVATIPNIKAERAFCSSCGAWRGHLGLEPSIDLFVEHLVEIFREVRRVLRSDGILALNLGDSYSNDTKWGGKSGGKNYTSADGGYRGQRERRATGLKPKDQMMMPSRVAMALQADGWYLRSMIPWVKRNSLPESVRDRTGNAVEYVFLISKSPRYYWDPFAVRVGQTESTVARLSQDVDAQAGSGRAFGGMKTNGPLRALAERPARRGRAVGLLEYGDSHGTEGQQRHGAALEESAGRGTRNRRNSDWFFESLGAVWDGDDLIGLTVNPQPFAEAHFATYPPALMIPFVLAGTSEKVCADCGAPWIRKVEKIDSGKRQKMADGWDTGEGGHGTIHRNGREAGESGKPVMTNQTTGWNPSCDCDSVVCAATVLDPFSGAGSTGLAALRLGRRYIGIELSQDYAEMSRRRLAVMAAQEIMAL